MKPLGLLVYALLVLGIAHVWQSGDHGLAIVLFVLLVILGSTE